MRPRILDASAVLAWLWQEPGGQEDVEIVAHDRQQAVETALLRPVTRHLGLSLGDRACLALARSLRAPAVTADRAWLSLDAGVEIQCIR